LLPQTIFINDSSEHTSKRELSFIQEKEKSLFKPFEIDQVRLNHGVFNERRELIKNYIKKLSVRNIFQNHLLESGFRLDTPCTELHGGWEETHCQLRGHFAGHWLSAAAKLAASDADAEIHAKIEEALDILQDCQKRNGGEWAGSIPEKYFGFLEQEHQIWSPQYTVHKTLMGLLDVYEYTGKEKALTIIAAWSLWFERWIGRLETENKAAVIYRGECAGMLEFWTRLYKISPQKRYLHLAEAYAAPDIFQNLQESKEALSHSHANASIPWILGAAALYEQSKDPQFLTIVKEFWQQAVVERGMFSSSGANAGEYWIPAGNFENYLGERTQEHCTVYNMIRLADYLYSWTGESSYADYIERALWNGILAQQNKHSGLVSYFLPTAPGSKKAWGNETKDFWCCHGTLVQAHAELKQLIWHRQEDGISLDQFIPSLLEDESGLKINLDFIRKPGEINKTLGLKIQIDSREARTWTLRVRLPSWTAGEPEVLLDGQRIALEDFQSYLCLRREWQHSTVLIQFSKTIRKEYLPGSTKRYALLDGPLMLAALSPRESRLPQALNFASLEEHQYRSGQEWQSSYYLLETETESLKFVPLYDICDEVYTSYFL